MSYYSHDLQKKLKTLRFVAYFRKSTTDKEDKQLRSIQGQREDLGRIQDLHGLSVVAEFEEKESAFHLGRPFYRQMIELISRGEADAVLVWHPNRICRNYSDGGEFVQLMSDKKLKVVLTPYSIFEDNPRDKEYLMAEFTRATRDSDEKSEAIKRGNRTKLTDGHIPSGRLCEGYVHTKDDKGLMINSIDPERFPLLQKAAQLVVKQKCTPLEALETLNNEWGYRTRKTKRGGNKPLSRSTWYRLLSNVVYTGDLSRYGDYQTESRSAFKPLLTQNDYQKIQIILGNKSTRRRTKHNRVYSGQIKCGECGSSIITEEKWQVICSECKFKFHQKIGRTSCPNCQIEISMMGKPTILHYEWLVCGKKKKNSENTVCTQHTVKISDFEHQVLEALSLVEIPEAFGKWALRWLKKINHVEVGERQQTEQRLRKLANSTQTQIDKLLELRLEELISDEEYFDKKKYLQQEKDSLESKISELSLRADGWINQVEKTFYFSTNAKALFENGDAAQKRLVLQTISPNLTLIDGKVLIELRKPFFILKKAKENVDILNRKSEPNILIDDVDYSKSIESSIPTLIPRQDSNLR